jgi:hypothetical protein
MTTLLCILLPLAVVAGLYEVGNWVLECIEEHRGNR